MGTDYTTSFTYQSGKLKTTTYPADSGTPFKTLDLIDRLSLPFANCQDDPSKRLRYITTYGKADFAETRIVGFHEFQK